MTYQETVDFLFDRLPMYQKVGSNAYKKDLTNTLSLLELLGNPHKHFRAIHIAGTNGKGTVAHSMASILQESGYSTGLYTSPHLKSYRERIRYNGAEIEEDYVINFVQQLVDDIDRLQPSFFELTVAMAFAYFAHKGVDMAVVETGLGGRLDSTNVLMPEISIITTIGYDHQDMLGETLAEIAEAKAGIIKPGVTCIVGNDIPHEAMDVIRDTAESMDSSVNEKSNSWSLLNDNTSTSDISLVNDSNIAYEGIVDQGFSFQRNVPTIVETCHELVEKGYKIYDTCIVNGLNKLNANTGLKGRWQVLSKNPKAICDVGHNEQGIKLIMEQIEKETFNQLHVVFGTVKGKDLSAILPLMNKDAIYYFCAANVPRSLPVQELIEIARQYGLKGEGFPTVSKAVDAAYRNSSSHDLIFIGGSTFVVAEIDNL